VNALGGAAERLQLLPGAREEEIAVVEGVMQRRLPDEYRAWLAIANGQEPGGLSILPSSGWFASLPRVLEQWRHERAFDLEEYAIVQTQDHERIRFFVFHPYRITIGGSAYLDGHNTVLDLIPGPAGNVGQLLDCVTECDFVVIGTSLAQYFDRVAALVEMGKLAPQTLEEIEWLAPVETPGRWEWLVRGERRRRR
jgi:cell wall assembly regulator SMI1